jgi:hypothetical protein
VVGLADRPETNRREGNRVRTKAIQAALAALKIAGVADDQIEAALKRLGLDAAGAQESAAKTTRGTAKTVSTETKVRAAEPSSIASWAREMRS